MEYVGKDGDAVLHSCPVSEVEFRAGKAAGNGLAFLVQLGIQAVACNTGSTGQSNQYYEYNRAGICSIVALTAGVRSA